MRAHDNTTGGVRERQAPPQQFAVAAEVLTHLAEPTRLHLLSLLGGEEQDVSSLAAQVAASRSSVSQHLSRLRLAGLVQARRQGRRMLYRLTSDHLTALISEVLGFADHVVRGIPHHRDTLEGPADAPERHR